MHKVIAGGQTGGDLGGLLGARDAGLRTGGTAPRGWKTERGPMPELAEFGLVEHTSADYPPRTKDNVRAADGTVIFAPVRSPGCELTARLCRDAKKPYLIVGEVGEETVDEVIRFVDKNNIRTLNVAGNRESVYRGLQEQVRQVIRKVVTHFKT